MRYAKYLLSVERSELSYNTNLRRTKSFRDYIDGAALVYLECQGVYKGSTETSFLIHSAPDNDVLRNFILNTLQEFEQECALFIDTQGMAWFLYPDGREVLQGKFVCREKETALRQDGYTYFPDRDQYWVIEPLR